MGDNVWHGAETLALSFDLGTTQSAASITHLAPNQPVKVRVVTKWPSSPNSSKIPTVILYDDEGTPEAIGAETKDDAYAERIGDDLTECKWFKLHLHPVAMQPPPYEAMPDLEGAAAVEGPSSFEVPPLPPNVSVEQAYSDFIKYLFDNTKSWFESNAPDGDAIWKKLEKTIKLVIAHPNGWSLPEQTSLKRAVTSAGIMPSADVEEHVVFVTESEASVHFALLYSANQQSQWLSPESAFAVVDAGGSTVDICVYEVSETQPKLKLREAKTSDCTQSGAIFVSRAAEEVIKAKLGKSKFNTPEFVGAMVDGFDTKTKLVFDSVEDNYVIKFGFDRDTDKAAGIARGRLTLTGEEVKRAFEPCVTKIIQSLRDQIAGLSVPSILLVGGFGESPYLLRRIREVFEVPGTRVVTADEPSKKAVAEGGCLFFAKDNVVARGTRFEFGIPTMRLYEDWAHERGSRKVIITPRGSKYISGGWTCIVPHGAIIDAEHVHRRNFVSDFLSTDSLDYAIDVMTFSGYDGETIHNGWSRDDTGAFHEGFVKCCSVSADLTPLAATLPWSVDEPTGTKYKDLDFDICLLFGGTRLKAELRWKVNGVEQRGRASIITASFL